MKGNIIIELRKVVSTMYAEGHEEVFGLSIINSEDDGIKVQVADFYFESSNLEEDKYPKTYAQAKRAMLLVSARCKGVTAVASLICSEVPETMYLEGNVLRVFNLNSGYAVKNVEIGGGKNKEVIAV